MQAQQKTFEAFSMPHWITSKQVYFLSRANLKHSLQKVVSWRDELGKQKDRWRKANESGTPACTRKWMRRTSKWYDLSTSILLWRSPINKIYIRVHCTLAVDLNSLISSHRTPNSWKGEKHRKNIVVHAMLWITSVMILLYLFKLFLLLLGKCQRWRKQTFWSPD